MSNIKIQLKRGTTAQVDAITPDSGEPIWETDGLKLAIGDGSTAGGLHVMMESLFNANTILYATANDTPLALTVAASRIVGRKASGAIAAMTGAETLALLTGANLDVGAFDVRGQTLTADGLTSGRVIFAGASGVLSDASGFTFATDTLTIAKIISTGITGFKTTATFVPDSTRTNYALSIGNRAAELTVNLANSASQNLELFQMNVNFTASGGAPTSTSAVRLVRIRSTHDTVDMPNLRLMNINTYMDVQKSLQDAYGQMSGIDFYTNAVTIGGEAAVAAFNIDANSAVTGNVRGVIINVYGAGLPASTSIGLEIRTDGGVATLTEGIRVWSVGGNSINYGLYIGGTINTADIRFHHGATLVDDGTNLTLANANLILALTKKLFIGETVNTKMTTGITIHHGSTTNEVIALKGTGVAHGMTDIAETDTYGVFTIDTVGAGGVIIRGFTEETTAFRYFGYSTNDNTTKAGNARAVFEFRPYKKSGADAGGVGADANLLAIFDPYTCRFIFDAEGSAHADVEWTTYQEHDDIELLNKLEILMAKVELNAEDRQVMEELNDLDIVHFDDNPFNLKGNLHGMVNITRLAMLQVGALRQLVKRLPPGLLLPLEG